MDTCGIGGTCKTRSERRVERGGSLNPGGGGGGYVDVYLDI